MDDVEELQALRRLAELEARAGSVQTPQQTSAMPLLPGMNSIPTRSGEIVQNAGRSAIAGIPDMFLNAPSNAANLALAGIGTAATAAGHPDLAPSQIPTPNLVRGYFEKQGWIKPQDEPQTQGERYLAAVSGGAVAGVPGGLPGMLTGAATNVIGQAASDISGSPTAGLVASLLATRGANALSNYGSSQLAMAKALQSQKQPLIDTMNEVRKAGYVIPPSTTNPTLFNRILESIAGKAGTAQDTSLQNQGVTDALTRKALGVASDMPITQDALDKLAFSRAAPYRDMSTLAPISPPIVGQRLSAGGLGPLEPIYGKAPTAPSQLVEQWRAANLDAKLNWNQFSKQGDVSAYKAYEAARERATSVEQQMELAAQTANRPEMVNALRGARTDIAQIHDVERALNPDRGEVSALDFARAKDKGVSLSGDLLTAAKMGSAFPTAVKAPEKIGSPGVNQLMSALSSGAGAVVGGATGGVSGGAAGAVIGPLLAQALQTGTRKMIMTPAYQRLFGTPTYDASLVGRTASKIPITTQGDALLRAFILQQQLQGQQQ